MIQGLGQEITEIPAFGHDITEVRAMGELVWQKSTSIPDYLCFTALESGTFTLTIPAAVTSDNLTYVEYSLDGRNWTRLTVDDTTQSLTTPTIQAGGKVYWRGSGIQYMTSDSRTNNYFIKTSYFSSSNRFDASGNIMSMLYAEDFEGKTAFPGTSNQYYNIGAMFQHCEFLVHAADLLLPATTLKHLCYTGMFYYCTMLVNAPSLPATVISNANYCYRYMFQGCSSLITPPDLSHVTTTARSGLYAMFFDCSSLTTATLPQASHLMQYCYYNMYRGCTSITSADLSSARTIDTHACENMFYGCSSLTYVKCLATDISATDCLTNWLSGVSSTGTFIQAEGVEWPRGASGIPTGWVDVEKRTMPSGYKQVEYLQGMGASRINLGIQFQKNIRILQDITYLTQNTFSWGMNAQNYEVIWGPGNGVDNFYFGLGRSNDGRKWTPNTYYEYDYDFTEGAMVAKINNEIYRQTTGSQPTRNTIYLFCYNNKETDLRNLYMRSQYFKLYMNGVLTKDLVASVRESDGMAGFYDFVNGTFLTSDTDTPFTAGEEI